MDDGPFTEQPVFQEPVVERKKRRKRGPRPDPVPRKVTLDLEKALEITAKLREEDGMLLVEIVKLLNTTSKRSRRRITAALEQVFK